MFCFYLFLKSAYITFFLGVRLIYLLLKVVFSVSSLLLVGRLLI